ncbi:hypothetical protein [Pseudomonas sp. AIG]
MDFPVLGDADQYTALGISCADYILGRGDIGSTCYDPIRPIGISVYQAIPFMMTGDLIDQNYITVFLNLACLMLLVGSLLIMFYNLSDSRLGQRRWVDYFGGGVIVITTLVFCVAYIPVRLSDIQSFACFTGSLAVLSSEKNRRSAKALIAAGLMAAMSVLMKPNYVVSIFFLVMFWFCFDFKAQFQSRFKYLAFYLCGVSVCLLQVALVYSKSGIFWFYDPRAMEVYIPTNAQPFVELIAYTEPFKSSYVSKLQVELSALQFTALKLYEGFSKFYWAVYMGRAPFEVTPVTMVVESGKLLCMQILLFVFVLLTFASFWLKNKWITVVVFMTTASTLLTAYMLHTENRYYLLTKVFWILVLMVLFVRLVNRFFPKREVV